MSFGLIFSSFASAEGSMIDQKLIERSSTNNKSTPGKKWAKNPKLLGLYHRPHKRQSSI
jgi:hypothetical protein